jgi:DNA/RNA endonuclease YhcR with UshA esterase domain
MKEVGMKTPRILFLLLFAIALIPAKAQSISATDAKAHIGENATVCGKVASERTATSSRGEPTFINLDSAYPNQVFTILVWGDDRKSVGELPRVGSRVCATGLIKDYRGVPEIVVRSSGQFSTH